MKSALSVVAVLAAPAAGSVRSDATLAASAIGAPSNSTVTRRGWDRPTPEQLDLERQDRMQRQRERRERARQKIASIKPDLSTLHRLTKEELIKADEEDHPWIRRAGWRNNDAEYEPNGNAGMADPGAEYDKWQQAYRMLGGFIDCDHSKSEDDHHSGDNEQEEYDGACSRWMMWAAYVDPNYEGGGYDEYFGDGATGVLDCHSPDTEWELLGVYRQEFYQFIEQISKHLWAIDEYEYVVALAGLAYMTDYDCFYVGGDGNGNSIYAGVAPKSEGKFEMALYTDGYCLTPNEDLGITFDDYGLTNNVQLSSGDHNSQDNGENNNNNENQYSEEIYEWWEDTQEYTLTQLNDVYESFKYCTSCVDYPTYQDGYFIGDYGTDDDDLINQCWKFYSHDSFTCEADCIALGHAQGTILSVEYGGATWGEVLSDFYTKSSNNVYSGSDKGSDSESRWSRMMANIFVTFSFIVFVATFLAFAVARRSRHRERSSGKSRRLLDEDRSSSRRRSKSKSGRSTRGSPGEGDGLYRSRSKSQDGRSKSKSRSKSASRRVKSRDYEPPSTKSKSGRKSSRRHLDDF